MFFHGVILQSVKDDEGLRVKNGTQQDDTNRKTKQTENSELLKVERI